MAKQKEEFVTHIASRTEDFPQWYTDIILKSDMVDYSEVKGCMVIKPYGYAVWELMQHELDTRFKATGHKNAYFPLFIPEHLLQKEKDHVEGFAPEVAWVTQGGEEKLAERLCVRPTSETIICSMYSKWIQSYRDLPLLYNQWANVVRWEKNTRPFLRTSEFLWQEGHTAHATAEEAQEETERMLEVYRDFMENVLAIPVICGRKSEKEKFAGAEATYTLEAMMQDGKALQMGTSHNLGDHFAKAYDITYLSREGRHEYCFTTSWGVSTRMIGGLIMVHGDDRGLVLPPRVAPTQVMILPIAMHKEGVLDAASKVRDRLAAAGIRVKMDDSDNSMGWKCAQYEMKGVPVRVELGPRDIEAGQCVLVRRNDGEKTVVKLEELEAAVKEQLALVQKGMYEKALKNMQENTYEAHSLEEAKQLQAEHGGFIKTMWCGELECELKMKEEGGMSSRCMPLQQECLDDKCAICGKPAKHSIYWGIAY